MKRLSKKLQRAKDKRMKAVCQSCRGVLVDDLSIPAIVSADQLTEQEEFRIDFEGFAELPIPDRQHCLFNWSVLLSLPQGHRPCTTDVTVTNE